VVPAALEPSWKAPPVSSATWRGLPPDVAATSIQADAAATSSKDHESVPAGAVPPPEGGDGVAVGVATGAAGAREVLDGRDNDCDEGTSFASIAAWRS
jgi:hypothetical protein